MANKSKTHSKKKNSGMIKLKIVAQMLQKSLLLGKRSSSSENEEVNVPEDVKAGHFAVIAVDDYELKRFVVPLSYLTYPSFLRLLEQAEEEYGFDHEGALTIPCSPSEFERLLAENWAEESGDSTVASGGGGGGTAWSSFNKTMVIKSC